MITCARRSAANEPARLPPTDRAWRRHGKPSDASAREDASSQASAKEDDKTFDSPVSNVSSTVLVGTGVAFLNSGQENSIGGRPAPKVFPSNVSGTGYRAGKAR
jgi:hypothetical protein